MKRFLKVFGTLAFTFVLASCNSNDNSSSVFIESASFELETNESYVLQDEKINLSKSHFIVTYSDGSIQNINVNDEILNDFDYTFGVHTSYLKLDADYDYSYPFTYYVFDNLANLNIVKSINNLPYINSLNLESVDEVIELKSNFENLNNDNKNFLNSYFSNIVDRLYKSENYLISFYFDEKVDELDNYFRTLIFDAYSSESINLIRNYIDEFKSYKNNIETLSSVLEKFNITMERINDVSSLEMSLSDYKEAAYNSVIKVFQTNMFNLKQDGDKFVFEQISKDYSENDENSALLQKIRNKIFSGTSKETVNELYKESFLNVEEKFIELFAADAKESLLNAYDNLILIESDLLAKWDKNYISIDGLFNNISTSFIDDNRWWIPEPYKICTILDNIDYEIANVTSSDNLITLYNDLLYEITRSVLQKNLENYYSIWRNLNGGYDTGDTKYWNLISDYWGDTSSKAFVYNGPLSIYSGNTYGDSGNNCFRLCGFFYKDGQKVDSIHALMNKYYELRDYLAPDPLAIVNITVNKPTKTTYKVGETLDLSGGSIVISYNDTSSITIDMEDSMLSNNEPFNSVGSKTISFVIEDPKLNTSLTIEFGIVVETNDEEVNTLISAINNLQEITVPHHENVEEALRVLALFNSMDENKRTDFVNTFSAEYGMLKEYEAKCVPLYAKETLADEISTYEKLNYYCYPMTTRENIDSSYQTMIEGMKNASSFGEIDKIGLSFNENLNSHQIDNTLSLDEYKNNSKLSLDRILSYNVYKFSGESKTTKVEELTKTLKNNESVEPIYTNILEHIDASPSIERINSIYADNVNDLYSKFIDEYLIIATEESKNVMYQIRNTLSPLWIAEGADIMTLPGEATNSEITTDYTSDSGYYIWYIPTEFCTGYVYRNIIIQNELTKYDIYNTYLNYTYEMARATFNRNLVTALCFELSRGRNVMGSWWGIIECEATFTYDGVFEEYYGKTYESLTYRLWRPGWNPDYKITSFSRLCEAYNVDISKLL